MALDHKQFPVRHLCETASTIWGSAAAVSAAMPDQLWKSSRGDGTGLAIRASVRLRIGHIGEVDTPTVGRIARDFRKRCEGKGADASVQFPSPSKGAAGVSSKAASTDSSFGRQRGSEIGAGRSVDIVPFEVNAGQFVAALMT